MGRNKKYIKAYCHVKFVGISRYIKFSNLAVDVAWNVMWPYYNDTKLCIICNPRKHIHHGGVMTWVYFAHIWPFGLKKLLRLSKYHWLRPHPVNDRNGPKCDTICIFDAILLSMLRLIHHITQINIQMKSSQHRSVSIQECNLPKK